MADKHNNTENLIEEIKHLKRELEKYKGDSEKGSYYTKLINNMPFGLAGLRVIYDSDSEKPIDHLIEFYNQTGLEYITSNYPLSNKDITGRTLTDIFPEVDQILEWINNVGILSLEEDYEQEIERYYSDALKKWFYLYIYIPKKGFYLLLMEDITDKVSIEEALIKSEQEYRNIYESSPIGIFQTTTQGKFVRANLALSKMCGYDDQEDLMTNINQEGLQSKLYVDPTDRKKIINKVLQTYDWCDFVVRFKKKNKDVFTVKMIIRQVKSEKEPAYYLEGFVEDITERIRIQKELRESKNKYQVLFEKMSSGFAYCRDIKSESDDSNFLKIIEINASLERIIDKPKSEVVGKTVKDILPIFWTDEYKDIRSKINLHIDQKKDFSMELFIPIIDKWLFILSYVPRDGFVAFMVNDISERKRAEKLLETRLRYETGIVNASKILLKTNIGIDEAMKRTLREMLYVSQTSRVYIFKNKYVESKGLCMDMIYEECSSYATPYINDPLMHEFPYKNEPGSWKDTLSTGNYIIGMTEDFPADVKSVFNEQNILSILVLPIFIGKRWYGSIGFDDVEKRRIWNEEDIRLLKTVADMIGSYLERRETIQQIKESENRYRAVVEDQTELIIRFKDNGDITFVNEAYCRYFNTSKEKIIGNNHKQLSHRKYYDKFLENIQSLNPMSPSITDEYEVTTSKGKRILRMTDRAIYDDNSNIIEYQSVGKDITEQKKAEQFLKESESKYRTLFETANDAIFILESTYYVDCNIQAVKLLNVESKDDIIGMNLSYFPPENQPDGLYSNEKASKIIQRAIKGEPQFFQWRIMLPSKKLVDVEVNLNSFQSLDKKLLIAIVRDITERKKAEEKIKNSLKEKEILLREVHHRVKNNLQIISSIINLQANNTKVEEIKMIIKEIRNRILSMALIHEKLYQSDNIAKVDFSTYVRSLILGLFNTYAVTEKKIKIDIDIYNAQLNLDFVVPCGLIINEVVSNSIKYAFPRDMSGRIKVSFQPSEDGEGFVLDIIDNGVGMPEHIDFNKTLTLGLRLIRALITQLNGKVSIDRKNGTHYHIEFKSKWYLY